MYRETEWVVTRTVAVPVIVAPEVGVSITTHAAALALAAGSANRNIRARTESVAMPRLDGS